MINEQLIFLDQTFQKRDDVLAFLAKQAVAFGNASDEKTVFDAFVARENQSTTGMMDGFAIPHAKSSAITQAHAIVIRNNNDIEWESLDGTPIKMAIALLIPDGEQGTTHLQALSKIARLLMKADVKEGLLNATSPADVKHYLDV